MDSVALAKGPAGQYSTDLVKACTDYFTRNYPECVKSTDHGTVMCPPVFPFKYIAPMGQASGANKLSKIEEDTIRGDNAELKIFQLLERLGENTGQPMFVLMQLKLSDFFKNVVQQMFPTDHSIFSKTLKEGEIDFMIIHRKIGVILVEVKAKDEFSKSLQSGARKQLQKGEEIIDAFLQADHKPEIRIPVYKVIAMPNVAEQCRGSSEFIGLRGIDVRSDNDFKDWWERTFPEKDFEPQQQQKLQHLISVCVCQMSEVNSAVLSGVYKKIDTQNFLQQSYEKGVKDPTSDKSQLVYKPAKQEILYKQFLFLNPDQLRIWNGDHHMFFNGSSGSGKTILLQFRALRCAKDAQQKVVVVVPVALTANYKQFFFENYISTEVVDVLSPLEFFHGSYFENNVPSHYSFHFFADELQTFQNDIPDLLMRLETLMARFVNSDYYCWIAYDYMQRNEKAESQDITGGLSSGAKLQSQVRNLCQVYNFHHSPCLKTVVRSTLEIYNYVQSFVKKSLEDMLREVIPLASDHIDEETKRSWNKFVKRYDVSNYLGHHICGPSVAEIKNVDLDGITGIITNEIKNWTTKDCLYRVAVLVTTPFLKEELCRLTTAKGIPVCDVENKENAIVLDYGHKAHSYEWPVVIVVSCADIPCLSYYYTMLTRAVTRLVVITNRS